MIATKAAPVKSKIVLLSHKDPAEPIELDPNEGPAESRLAVAQDVWGLGNLTPLDNVMASTAIGVLAVTNQAKFGVVCQHLGNRLFRFSRDMDVWIDAYECDPRISVLQKRPKDKVKLSVWNTAGRTLGANRFTKLAVLNMNAGESSLSRIIGDCATSLRPGGDLFFAGLVADRCDRSVRQAKPELASLAECREAISAAGLIAGSDVDLTERVKDAIQEGLANSMAALSAIRVLKQPWKSLRLAAYLQELEAAAGLYTDLDVRRIAAAGVRAAKALPAKS